MCGGGQACARRGGSARMAACGGAARLTCGNTPRRGGAPRPAIVRDMGILCVNGKTMHRNEATRDRCPRCRAAMGSARRFADRAEKSKGVAEQCRKMTSTDAVRDWAMEAEPYEVDAALEDAMAARAELKSALDRIRRGYQKGDAGRLEDKLQEVEERVRILEEEFQDRGGWSRYFLVTDGHLHTSMKCSSCRPTTQFTLITECSGMTEEEAIELGGDRVCTVCCPDAPVDVLSRRSRLLNPDERERQERREEEARKRAEKAARKKDNEMPAPIVLPNWRDEPTEIVSKHAANREIGLLIENLTFYEKKLEGSYGLRTAQECAKGLRMIHAMSGKSPVSDEALVEAIMKRKGEGSAESKNRVRAWLMHGMRDTADDG